MGCDIHLYVEKRENSKWVTADTWYPDNYEPDRVSVYNWGPHYERLGGPIYHSRNYDLFAILANVRNDYGFAGVDTGDGFVPIAAPRGIPDDACPEYITEVRRWGGDGHSHSYFTTEELMAYDWTQRAKKRGWVSPREFAKFYLSGKPDDWSGDINGPNVRHVSNGEMLEHITAGRPAFTWQDYHAMPEDPLMAGLYTQVEWEIAYYEHCQEFLGETMPKLWRIGKPDSVRIVFFFDN